MKKLLKEKNPLMVQAPYTQQEIAMQRDALTSLVDDIMDYRPAEELQGTLAELYEVAMPSFNN